MATLKRMFILMVALVLGSCGVINLGVLPAFPLKTKFVVDKSFEQIWIDLITLASVESLQLDFDGKTLGSATFRLRGSNFVECFPHIEQPVVGTNVNVASSTVREAFVPDANPQPQRPLSGVKRTLLRAFAEVRY